MPVGPVRIAELRRKAASGAVTEESLVWQEGHGGVATAPHHPRARRDRPRRFVSGAPVARDARIRRSAATPRLRRPRIPRTRRRRARAIARRTAAPRAATSIPLASRLATAEKLEPEPIADPFAVPARVAADATAPVLDAVDRLGAMRRRRSTDGRHPAQTRAELDRHRNGRRVRRIRRDRGRRRLLQQAAAARKPAPIVIVTTKRTAATDDERPSPLSRHRRNAHRAESGIASDAQSDGAIGRRRVASRRNGRGHDRRRRAKPSTRRIAALLGGPGAGPSVGGGGGGGSASSALSEEAIQRVVQQRRPA